MSAVSDNAAPQRHRPSGFLARVVHEPAAVAGGLIVLGFIAMALLAPWIAPYAPNASDWMAIRQPPDALHWFGTDDLGRDVLSRILYGSRASLGKSVV